MIEVRVLVTGASGYFAWAFINAIVKDKNIDIIAVSSNKDKLEELYGHLDIRLLTNDELINSSEGSLKIDAAVHTAFCRESVGCELVKSLNFLRQVLKVCKINGVTMFLNLSSQAVYGSSSLELGIEDGFTNLNPEYLYAFAKVASEMMVHDILEDSSIRYINIRMGALIGPSIGYPNNIIYKFIEQGFTNKSFNVIGGKQNFSFIDVRDAVTAVHKLLYCSDIDNISILNLGPLKQTNIVDLADVVCCILKNKYDVCINYNLIKQDIFLNTGMSSDRIYNLLKWKPRYTLEDTVEDTASFIKQKLTTL